MKHINEIGLVSDYGTPTFSLIRIEMHFCGMCAYFGFVILGVGIMWRSYPGK